MHRKCSKTMEYISYINTHFPNAQAQIKGIDEFKAISGTVSFYTMEKQVIVIVNVGGLPISEDVCKQPVFALHIHQGNSCSGNAQDSLADTKTHYNPNDCPHPYHAGDLPPIFSNGECGWLAFATGRFTVNEILGKTVVIHQMPDDFTTQPSGNSGKKIACGVIKPLSFKIH